MWRCRIILYGTACLVALFAGFLHGIPDSWRLAGYSGVDIRSALGIALNLLAVPAIEWAIHLMRGDAMEAARSLLDWEYDEPALPPGDPSLPAHRS